MKLFFVWFFLTVGNYIYQFFGSQAWSEAFERSYFQAIAIVAVWFVSKMNRLAITSPCGKAKP